MKDITSKYIDMIDSFDCDFQLAKDRKFTLKSIQILINMKNKQIIKDIKLLNELSFMLRHKQAKIVLVEDSDIK